MVKLLVLNLSLSDQSQSDAELEIIGAQGVGDVDVTVSSLFDPCLIDEFSSYDAMIINVDGEDAPESLDALLEAADNPLADGCLEGKLASVRLSLNTDDAKAKASAMECLWETLTEHGMIVVPTPGDEADQDHALAQGRYLASMARWLG